MLKKLLPLLLLAATALAACSPGQASRQPSGPPMAGCNVVDVVAKPNPTIVALIPPITDQDHILGAKTAQVTIIEYSDYQ